jgi:hypothetical protein
MVTRQSHQTSLFAFVFHEHLYDKFNVWEAFLFCIWATCVFFCCLIEHVDVLIEVFLFV